MGISSLIRDQSNKINFPYVWLLTQDSKATAFTRLLFAMRPWYASEPRAGRRRAGRQRWPIPIAVSRAWALQLLLDAPDRQPGRPARGPGLGAASMPPGSARLWGDGLIKSKKLTLNQTILDWSRSDPEGLLAAAKWVAAGRPPGKTSDMRNA